MVTVMREKIFIDPLTASAAELTAVRQLVAHKLTHQWFANSVSFDDWRHLWFFEAFAKFAEN